MSESKSVPSGSRFKRSGGACLSPTYTGNWLFSETRHLAILSDSIKPWPMTAVVIDHLFINPFFVTSLSFYQSLVIFCILLRVKDSPQNDLILSNCSLISMISSSCLSLSGVRELIIKFVNSFAFDLIASITYPLGSSHSITKLNSIGFSISVFPPTKVFFSHVPSITRTLSLLSCITFSFVRFFSIIHHRCCPFPLHHSFVF
jgi:hypothetical protein